MNDVSVYLGRQRGEGYPIERIHFAHMLFVLKAIKNWTVERTVEGSELKLHLLVINKRNDVSN